MLTPQESLQLNKMRQDFVANVSHELRTPLTVIHGYVESLLQHEGLHDESLQEIFRSMQQQTRRMETLIEDLLLLAQIENESPHAQRDSVELSKLIQDLQNDLKPLTADHAIYRSLVSTAGILGNAHELRNAFSNLVTNAIRYTKPGGRIDISTGFLKTGQVFFEVCDTGVGIEKSHIPRLTERFYRVDKGRSRKSGGTGLGLAIVKHVLMRHDAELHIESTVGVGSVFRCVFPLERSIILS